MTKQRRSISAEFKHEAADLVLKQNSSFIVASRHSASASRFYTGGLTKISRSAKALPRRAKR
ncbi:hypothetical protein B7453_02415 [Pseudomonas sp. IB20]|nr:hypothetical protein B7453_02415 [Pseudomonas sp. IB20]